MWINSGTTSFQSVRPPAYVAEQLDAARRWGMGRMFADFAYGDLERFDYGPYDAAMRAASRPGVVDPTLRRLMSTRETPQQQTRCRSTGPPTTTMRFDSSAGEPATVLPAWPS